MTKTLWIAAPIIAAMGILAAGPAAAAPNTQDTNVRTQIKQLDRTINRLPGLSSREEARLDARLDNVRSLQRRYARGGFTQRELRVLNHRITSIKIDMRKQSRDGDRRRR